ncbi:MAG: hypothetical protein JRH16_04040, partial [Deltaproteobacteria bacterium]|nr:hypothetical protein [Deltaproteobacteria bacterium]
GDRMRMLGPRETARARVMRRGPRVIDVPRTLTLAAKRGIFRERPPWHDEMEGARFDCC